MSSKLYTSKKKNARIQTPDVSTAPASGIFEPRPFVPQHEATQQSQPDLNTALTQSQRYGHNLSRMHSAIPSTPIQPKVGLAQPLQHQKITLANGGSPLPKPVLQKMEAAFGTNFSDVRTHEGSEAKSIGAIAYTQGNHIHFQPGRYNPMSQSGQQLLGHELTHIVQQRAGQVKIPQNKGTVINSNPNLEKEADIQGAKAAQGERVQVADVGSGLQRQATSKMSQVVQCSNEEDRQPRFYMDSSSVAHASPNEGGDGRFYMDSSGVAHGSPNFLDKQTKDSLHKKLKRKPEEQKALAQWNTNAQGRNQGLAHILDYAYARPPKKGLEELEANTGGQPISGKGLREQNKLTDKQIQQLEKYELDKEDGTEKKLLPVSTKDENGKVIKTNPENSKQNLNTLKAQQKEYIDSLSPEEKKNLGIDEKNQELKNQIKEAEKQLADQTAYKVPREESKKGRIEQVETVTGKGKGSFKQDKGEIVGVTEALNNLPPKPESLETKGSKGGEITLKNPEWVNNPNKWVKDSQGEYSKKAGWTLKDNVKVPNTATSQSYTTGNEKQSLKVEKWGPNPDTMKYSSVMGASTNNNQEQEKKKKKK
ncbi:MAG TPA: DUF4157 domain-containing protein [Leptolyngbyaceae cyanobacterium]